MKYVKKLLLIAFFCTVTFAISDATTQAKNKNKGIMNETIKWSYNKKNKTLTLSGKGKASADDFAEGPRVLWPTSTKNNLPKFKKIVFKKGITKIDRMFFDIEGVVSISLPSTVKAIKRYAITPPNRSYDPWSTTLTNITVSKRSKHFKSSKGILYSKNGKVLVIYPSGRKTTDFTTPKKVTTIEKRAFRGSEVQKVTLTSKLTNIKADAFKNSLVKEINFPKKLKSIGEYAFFNCQLQSVYLPHSLNHIGSWAFSNNRKLTTITLNNTCELNDSEFTDCSSYLITTEEDDYITHTIQRPITVNLGPKASVPLYSIIWDLGDYITFNVDPKNPHYYTKNGSLYKTRGNEKIYTPKTAAQ